MHVHWNQKQARFHPQLKASGFHAIREALAKCDEATSAGVHRYRALQDVQPVSSAPISACPDGPCALRKHRVRQCNGAAGRRLGSVRASASDVDSSARLPQGKCNAFAGARLEPVTTATRSEVIVDRDRVSNALPIDWQFLPLVAPPSSKSNRGCRPLRFSREHRTSCRDPSHKPLHPGQP